MASDTGMKGTAVLDEEECEEGEIKDDDAFEDVSSSEETLSLDSRRCRTTFGCKLRHVSPTYGSLSPSRPRVSEVPRKARSHYSTSSDDDRREKLSHRLDTSSDSRVHLASKLITNPSDHKGHHYSRLHKHFKSSIHDGISVDAAQEKENREDSREGLLSERSLCRKRRHSLERVHEVREFSCSNDNEEKVSLRKKKRELLSSKKLKEHVLKSGKKSKDASSKKKNGKGNKEKQIHSKKFHKSVGKRLSMSIIEKSKTVMRNKSFYETHPQENSLKIRLQAMLGGSVCAKPKDVDNEATSSSNSHVHCSQNAVNTAENVSFEPSKSSVKDDSSGDEIVEIPRVIIEPEVITLDSEEDDRDKNEKHIDDEKVEGSVAEDLIQNAQQNVVKLNEFSEEKTTIDDDEDLLELRRLALESSKHDSTSNSKDERNIDDDVLQLRLDALRSAYLRKHMERKQRGLTVKQKRRLSSPIDSPLSSISPSNSPSGAVPNVHCFSPETPDVTTAQFVPPPESIPLPPGEEDETTAIVDMELANTDDEKDGMASPPHSSEDRYIVVSDSESYQRDSLSAPFDRSEFPDVQKLDQEEMNGTSRNTMFENPKSLDSSVVLTVSNNQHVSQPLVTDQLVKNSVSTPWNAPDYHQFISNSESNAFSASIDGFKYPEVQDYSPVGAFHGYPQQYNDATVLPSSVPHLHTSVDFSSDLPCSDFSNQSDIAANKGGCSASNASNLSPCEYPACDENRREWASERTKGTSHDTPLNENVSGKREPIPSRADFACSFSVKTDFKDSSYVNSGSNQDFFLDEDEQGKDSSHKDVWNEESHIEAEEIDLSSMIVLDEVGHCSSPERETSVKSGDSNRVGSYHEDMEEDEEILRARVLSSLPKDEEIPRPQVLSSQSKKQPITYSNFSNNHPLRSSVSKSQKSSRSQSLKKNNSSSWNTPVYQRFLSSLRSENGTRAKSFSRKQRISSVPSSSVFQNKKVNVANTRRGPLVVPQTSLQVTIPADSSVSRRRVAESVSISPSEPQERFVIRVGEDSDSGEDDAFVAGRQHYYVNSSSPSSTPPNGYSPLPLHSEFESSPSRQHSSHSQEIAPVPVDFEKKVELLLKQVRLKQETTKGVAKESVNAGRNLQYKMTKASPNKKLNAGIPSEDVSSTPVGIRLLPSSKQEEYRRLKQQLALKEKQKQQQQHHISKRIDGTPGKLKEAIDQDRTISISRNTHNIMVNVINDTHLLKTSSDEHSSVGFGMEKDSSVSRNNESVSKSLPVNVESEQDSSCDTKNPFLKRKNGMPIETGSCSEHISQRCSTSSDAHNSAEIALHSSKECSETSNDTMNTLSIGEETNPVIENCESKRDHIKKVEKHQISVLDITSISTSNSAQTSDSSTGTKNKSKSKLVHQINKLRKCEITVGLQGSSHSDSNVEEKCNEQFSNSENRISVIDTKISEEDKLVCDNEDADLRLAECSASDLGKFKDYTSSVSISEETFELKLSPKSSNEKVQKMECVANVASNNRLLSVGATELLSDRLEMDSKSATSQEKLMEYERSLVTQRYSVVDDLTEMMQQLREIELERTTRSECAAEVNRLRAELARAEERLRQQDQLLRKKRVTITDAHHRMMQGRRKCLALTKTCISLGKEVIGTKYKVPSGGAEIMKSKLHKFAAYTKSARKAKQKDYDFDDKLATSTIDKTIEDECVLASNENSQSMCERNLIDGAVATVSSVQSTLSVNLLDPPLASETSSKERTAIDSGIKTENIQLESTESDKGDVQLHSHRQLLEYRSPLESLKLKTAERDPLAILCPFELMGSCQDEECQYSHQQTA